MTSPIDIRPDHLAMVQDVLRAHLPDGAEAWVFGSRATWTTKDSSDLDLAVQANGKITPRVMGELEDAFRESDLPYTVDVVDLAAVDGRFKEVVESQKVSLPLGLDGADGRSEWKRLPFSKAVLVNPRVHLERGAEYPYVDMASVNPKSRHIDVSKRRKYSGGGSRFQSGDTLMARITPCLENGKIARYQSPNTSEKAYGSTEFIVIRGRPDVTDTDFAYYLTWWEEVRNYAIGQMTGTSGRQRVPADCLDDLVVPIPPLAQQRAIAHILGTLDDKIDLNRRMNETLEEMARALFRSWFVDYDPVHAKMDGRWRRGESLPGLPADLYDLFPARMVESELGEVPEGWEVRGLGECYNLTMGQSPPGSTYNEHGEGMPFFQGKTDFGFRYPQNRKFCTAPGRIAQPDDTLVSVRAPVGAINMAWEKCCIGRGLAALRHKSGSSSFTYYAVEAVRGEIEQYEDTGTVFGAITKKQLETIPIIEPDRKSVDTFNIYVLSLDQRIRANVDESRTLSALRDALLPRMLSGKVRAKTYEQIDNW